MFIPRENCEGYFQVSLREIPFADSPDFYCKGSYNVIEARLLGFTYPDYLRYCRANFNGVLRGREGYTYCVFKNKKDCLAICEMLNREFKKVEESLK